jgi:hypothetical protein
LIDVYPDQTLKRVLILYADDETPFASRMRLGQVVSQTIARFSKLVSKYTCISNTLVDLVIRLDPEQEIFESACGLVCEVIEVAYDALRGSQWQVVRGVQGKGGGAGRRGVERVLKSLVEYCEDGEVVAEARRILLLL